MNNYYTLPRINNIIKINPNINCNDITPYISQTLIHYYNELAKEVNILCAKKNGDITNELNNEMNNYDEIIKLVNPYEYIFSKVPGSNYSVSKLKLKSMMFYDLLEIFQTMNILESYTYDIMNSLIVGVNYEDSLECLEMLRENYINDKFFCFCEYTSKQHNCIEKNKFNFIIYELNNYNNVNHYIILLIELILIILNNLNDGGNVIIKLNNIFFKPVIEILYLLSCLFEKVSIIKPNTSNITNFDKYIILQKFKLNINNFEAKNNYTMVFKDFILKYDDNNVKNDEKYNLNIHSISNIELPYYFLNKIDDINIIIGQQQLESLNKIINLLKSKNKDNNLELLKKNNIQKCVNWCEKYKIPCNKFSDRINIFLPLEKATDV